MCLARDAGARGLAGAEDPNPPRLLALRKLTYLVASTLDGQIALADGSFDCFAAAGDDHVADYLEAVQRFSAVIMGRNTYDVGLRAGVTDPYPALETYVVSASLKESPDPKVRLIAGDPAGFVRRLKATEGGAIYLCGGARLAAELLEAGLIDEIAVKLNPLVTGSGIPLFAWVKSPVLLALEGVKTYANGVVWLTYRLKPG